MRWSPPSPGTGPRTADLPAQLRVVAAYQRQALRHGWPTVVAVDETQTETSPGALSRLLARSGGRPLGFPVVADTSGRVADGYQVADLPWVAVTTSSGTISYHHDGWLTASALARAVTRQANTS
jgi:hypothetical protein